MKELKVNTVHLDEYDIDVNEGLTLSQIDAIAKSIIKYDTYGEREANKIALVMYYATSLSKEEIEEIGVDNMVATGFVSRVSGIIGNYYDIDDAVRYYESLERIAGQFAKAMKDPKVKEMINKVADSNAVSKK